MVACLVECGGCMSYRDLRVVLTGRASLNLEKLGLGEYRRLRVRHSSLSRAAKSLERKGLITLEGDERFGRVTRIRGLRIVWESLGVELIRRTSVGKRVLRSG